MNNTRSNMKVIIAGIAVFGCALGGLNVLGSRPAVAQAADATSEKPISLNMQGADVKVLLKALFAEAGANYSIDSDVSGTVSITMNNVGFLAALRSILHANTPPLTYDYTDGVYHVRVRKVEGQGQNQVQTTVTTSQNGGGDSGSTTSTSSDDKRWYKLPIDHYDVALLAQFLSSNPATATLPSASGAAAGGGGMGGGMGGGRGGMGGGMGGMGGGMGGMGGGMGGMGGGMGGMGGGMGMSGGFGGMGGGMGGGYSTGL